jgi:hypothetical protein
VPEVEQLDARLFAACEGQQCQAVRLLLGKVFHFNATFEGFKAQRESRAFTF